MVLCPKCKSENVVPILYGLPDSEGFEMAERGEVQLGGCIVYKGMPEYACKECGRKWSFSSLPATAIQKVRVKVWSGLPDEMDITVYELKNNGRYAKYEYVMNSRKCQSKEIQMVGSQKALKLFRTIKKVVDEIPPYPQPEIIVDDMDYRIQITYIDGRKQIVERL